MVTSPSIRLSRGASTRVGHGEHKDGADNIEGYRNAVRTAESLVHETSVHVGEASAKGESVENIKDVADVNAWSGNANSGNVNDLVNSFFVTPLVSDDLSSIGTNAGIGTPIFNQAPQCVPKGAESTKDFAENTTDKETKKEPSESSVQNMYHRWKFTRKVYSKELRDELLRKERDAMFMEDGASTL
ncbi:uncharacterized protein LOC106866808 isoform X1 [Brachypodium distachyon]|uniref:uncharacterized protein LOC106866808 isoform X1 n=1 Tax=Brachypodium distachyon TaxID=15368 RepID=UPI000D0CBD43|nr:uncharacterized protein LOC106866808 isoform X1 [Brachypodium distachyon]|eukprot:XP_024310816.1 uncharacterized protein LOC106866808 isoform X1 [Brachypodium distachyon]